ncbi:hypothetical protein NQ318_004995 [Aromia moschata]|uniref:Uncharacterized protein n=1 Tax=Aromia moschata TaxID=1265417 RepID=A0AAV8Y7P2_9CUCU|nr:hypothetical protein NQ318_004995 [Aromia moschata]
MDEMELLNFQKRISSCCLFFSRNFGGLFLIYRSVTHRWARMSTSKNQRDPLVGHDVANVLIHLCIHKQIIPLEQGSATFLCRRAITKYNEYSAGHRASEN